MFRKVQLKGFEKASFYMILTAMMTTFFSYFVKLSTVSMYLPMMVFLRFFFPLLLSIPYFYMYYDQVRAVSFRRSSRHLLRAIVVVLSQYTYFYYFTKGSLTNGVLLINTAPLFIPIISYFYLKYRVSRVVWVSLIVSFIGVICVLKPDGSVFDPFSIFGFLTGFLAALSQVLFGVNQETDTVSQNMFLLFLYTSLISLVVFLISLLYVPFTQVIEESFVSHGFLIPFVIMVGMGIGSSSNQWLRGKAYSYAKPASLAPFLYLSVVFAAIVDQFINPGTIHGFNFIIGMILVTLGTGIRIMYAAKA